MAKGISLVKFRAAVRDQGRNETLKRIAKDVLHIETLEERHSDRLDFHEVAVWSVGEALRQAFEAGRKSR